MGKIPVATAQLVGTFLEAIFYGQFNVLMYPVNEVNVYCKAYIWWYGLSVFKYFSGNGPAIGLWFISLEQWWLLSCS